MRPTGVAGTAAGRLAPESSAGAARARALRTRAGAERRARRTAEGNVERAATLADDIPARLPVDRVEAVLLRGGNAVRINRSPRRCCFGLGRPENRRTRYGTRHSNGRNTVRGSRAP